MGMVDRPTRWLAREKPLPLQTPPLKPVPLPPYAFRSSACAFLSSGRPLVYPPARSDVANPSHHAPIGKHEGCVMDAHFAAFSAAEMPG